MRTCDSCGAPASKVGQLGGVSADFCEACSVFDERAAFQKGEIVTFGDDDDRRFARVAAHHVEGDPFVWLEPLEPSKPGERWGAPFETVRTR